ncbi:MAG: glucan biosynthesis protein G [Candidatus Competibacteraceae bacterium]|jgi:glucans biosynthesis protein|nr:glucan biosynthesis protein G [Candidatus Competibacteraceae bacterium]
MEKSVVLCRSLLFVLILIGWASPNSAAPTLPPAETSGTTPPKRFNFADVHRRAANLALQPFQETEQSIPAFLRDLTYDQYRDIRFRADKGLWRNEGLPFEVQFAHLGFLFLKPVKINIVEDGEVQPIPYRGDWFDYGANILPEQLPAELGFAGFRLHYPLHQDSYYDEVAVFLGASYFRAVGQQQTYGLSARGLAIDTGLPKPEEFPVFREFWLEKPTQDATEITLYALLDSPRVTGAYRFLIKPGPTTTINVKAQVFLREAVDKLAIAPLTSMFFHGELSERFSDDFRPEVHDSDGLLLALGNGEWLWRPLSNPSRLQISAFRDNNPRGFGLLQRDRDFNNYQDLEALYQKRPSVWVEPLGEWGPGFIELVEIPTDAERYDNIVAFWIPEQPLEAHSSFATEYRLHFASQLDRKPPGGQTLATRIGAGGAGGVDPTKRRFVLDFGGKNLTALPEDTEITALVNASAGKIDNIVVKKNPFTTGWRASFELLPENEPVIELRCFLKSAGNVLTETWSYRWIAP